MNLHYEKVILLLIIFLYWSYGEPYRDNNFLLKKFERKNNILTRRKIKQKYKEGKIKVREGQKPFREDLLKIHNNCQVCGLENPRLLIASHIKPYLDSVLDECLDFNNGLLLCANHDKLFDQELISFNDDGTILISEKLSKNDISQLDIINKKISVSNEQKKYLKWHREHLV
ncbi:MAG: HNH endonuclease [Clostridiaceae bacterium]